MNIARHIPLSNQHKNSGSGTRCCGAPAAFVLATPCFFCQLTILLPNLRIQHRSHRVLRHPGNPYVSLRNTKLSYQQTTLLANLNTQHCNHKDLMAQVVGVVVVEVAEVAEVVEVAEVADVEA